MKKQILIGFVLGLFLNQNISAQERGLRTERQRQNIETNSVLRSKTNSLVPSQSATRQIVPKSEEWREMSVQEKKETVRNMTSKDRTLFLQRMKSNIVLEDLEISVDKEEEFKALFNEYQNAQKQIKEKFIIDHNLEQLSDEEATKRLNQSFDVGQQLLDNRKLYAQKFLKLLTPQQVLKLFQTEGRLREKLLDKKNNHN